MAVIVFPHSRHIKKLENVCLVQPELKPSTPLVVPEFHWEVPRVNLYGTVLKVDDGRYEMFYQCGNAIRVALATSADGETWEKPLINPVNFAHPEGEVILATQAVSPLERPDLSEQGELTNIVAGYHMPSVVYEPDKSERYTMFAFGEGGYHVATSVDGHLFTSIQEEPVIDMLLYKNPSTQKTWVSDVAPFFKAEDCYVAMVKTYELDENGITRRCVGYSQSSDLKNWAPVETIWKPGDAEDEIAKARGFEWADFYGLCPFNYGDGFLGYLWLFEIEKELPNGTNQGKIEVFLAHSEDGVEWKRVSDSPLIPWDLNFSGAGGMVTTPGAPIFETDRIRIFYSDNNYEHGMYEKDFTKEVLSPEWVIRCAEIPKERMIGVANGGVLTSMMKLGKGQKLRLNADATFGCVKLSILDHQRDCLAKYTVSQVDGTDIVLDIPDLSIDAICLNIELEDATLYAVELL